MITTDLSIHDYHAAARVSHSKAKTYAQRGARGYYISHVQKAWTDDDTKAFLAGRAIEDALQRPAEFRAKYIAKPSGMSFATKEGKTWREEQRSKGLEILESDDARAAESLLETLESCPVAQALIGAAQQQVTVLHDALARFPHVPGMQTRPDWLCLDGCAASEWRPYVLDLKTTSTLVELSSGRSLVKYGYHRQAAMAAQCLELEGLDAADLRFLLLGAEKAFPYRWRVVEVPSQLVAEGRRWADAQMASLDEHYETGEWPLVESEIVRADVPAWLDLAEEAA